ALVVREPGLPVRAEEREALGPGVVVLERRAVLPHDLRRVRHVPYLALLVVVPAEHALAQPVVEPAEVATALAVDPPEVLDLVGAGRPLCVREREVTALEAAPALVEAQIVLDPLDRHGPVRQEDHALAGRGALARILEEEAAVVGQVEEDPLPHPRHTARGA